jgi:methoxymalonate biosynthesis protein
MERSAIRNPQSETEERIIKCVVWDLDNTLWWGIAAEGPEGEVPPPDQRMIDIISTLEKRGILSSVASRNDPSLLNTLLAHPLLQGRFLAPQISWEPKSMSIQRIASRLNVGLDALAFVDDSHYERAEVSHMLPDVLVLAPDELDAALENPAFNPRTRTAETEQRARMYRQEEERKQAEASFEGNRLDFLRWCDMRLTITAASEEDVPRILELTERTHQLNSTGRHYTTAEIRERVRGERWLVPVARLTDRFGDYGMIGAAVVDRRPPWPPDVWLVELVMLSCRVEGRGIPAALLRWIMDEARRAEIKSLRAVYQINERNLPMRLLFRQTGFLKIAGDNFVTVAHGLSEPLPDYPVWLKINAE